jgi:integrase/recombinase XerD
MPLSPYSTKVVLRVAEVLALNTAAINFQNCEFQVIGKGNKKRWCYFGEASATALQAYFLKKTGPMRRSLVSG